MSSKEIGYGPRAAPRPPLGVARRRSRDLTVRTRARRLAPLAIGGVILALAIVFGILLEQVVLAQSAFRLADISKQLTEEQSRHQELLLKAARLESGDRIERIARDRLGMVEPRHTEYVVADIRTGDDRSIAGVTPGGAASKTARAMAADATEGENP